jgi:MOSC domain-containing protein YiiM
MITPLLLSIQVGLPKQVYDIDASGAMRESWLTAFFKEPTQGPIKLGREGLVGDGQADRRVHGGPEKAVLCYSASHYPIWREELKLSDLGYGAFGENFTVEGLTEATVCIGDTYEVGEVSLQVSQPRQPCWKLSRRFHINNLAQRVVETNRAGWYFRVIREGEVREQTPLILLSRPCPEWSIVKVNDIIYGRHSDTKAARELSQCQLLSRDWRKFLRRM